MFYYPNSISFTVTPCLNSNTFTKDGKFYIKTFKENEDEMFEVFKTKKEATDSLIKEINEQIATLEYVKVLLKRQCKE